MLQKRVKALILAIFAVTLILAISYALFISNSRTSTQSESEVKNLRALLFYKSSGTVWVYQFQEMLNRSMMVELWDITMNPFPNDAAILTNSTMVFLDESIDDFDLNSDQRTAIWTALGNGTSFFFNYRNAKVYYDKFSVISSWNRTNYVLLSDNHPILAPSFLYPAGTGWHSSKSIKNEWANSFLANTSVLPSDHKILLRSNSTKGEFSFPMVIYGEYGLGKFAVVTGRVGELSSPVNYRMLWVVPRVTYWLLLDDQPLRRYWSYVPIAFRDDDLGGIWVGNVEDQMENMSMALSWDVPLTWAFVPEESSREIWSDPKFIEKLKELEEAGHEIFLHAAGYAPEWQSYNYSEARARIQELIENYVQVLGHVPRGWVTPQHGYSNTIVQVLEDLSFKYDSENRKNIGTTLLNDKVIDVSAQRPELELNAYKDWMDREWLFGGGTLSFYTHFYQGDFKKIDQWLDSFKEFASNYPHRWITLDELAYVVHGQPNVYITQMMSRDTNITVEVDSTTETTFYLELKNLTISRATVNGAAIYFRSNNSLAARIGNGKTKIVLEVGTPKEDVMAVYSDTPPTLVSLNEEKLQIDSKSSEGRNATIQIQIFGYDNWYVNCTEDKWGQKWNLTTRILTIWMISDGFYTVTIDLKYTPA